MISYDDALQIAKRIKENIDYCDEYDIGYKFKAKDDEFTIGGDGPCYILKNTGKPVPQTEFYDNFNPVFIKEIAI